MTTITNQLSPRSTRTWLIAAAIFIVGMVGAGAAVIATSTVTEVHGSRAVQYTSLDQLRGDSTLVIEGRVVSQERGESPSYGDAPAFETTISTVELTQSVSVAPSPGGSAVEAGGSIQVTQLGTLDQRLEVPLLRSGGLYLLFLTQDESGAFYITGASAGMYEASGDGVYRPSFPDLDVLPSTLRFEEAAGR